MIMRDGSSTNETNTNSSLSKMNSLQMIPKRQQSQKKSKSPIPLRRKDDANVTMDGRLNSTNKGSKNSAKKQLFKGIKNQGKSKKLEEFEKYL